MQIRLFAVSHLLAAAGVAILALSTPADAGSDHARVASAAPPDQIADPDNLAGQRGNLRGLRFAFEAAVPVYQNLNGPQMDTDVILTLGLQYAW